MLPHTRILLNVSAALALEYEAVLKRPGLIPGFSAAEMDVFLDYLLSVATLWPSVRRLRPSLRDPDGERILEGAEQCDGIIVTHIQRDLMRQFHLELRSCRQRKSWRL